MTQPDHDVHETLTEALARVGVIVTDEGKARARARLAAAREGWTEERFQATRDKLGMTRPERAA